MQARTKTGPLALGVRQQVFMTPPHTLYGLANLNLLNEY